MDKWKVKNERSDKNTGILNSDLGNVDALLYKKGKQIYGYFLIAFFPPFPPCLNFFVFFLFFSFFY